MHISKPRLQEKVAIVTGAAQDLGAYYAKTLASHGAAVICADVADCTAVSDAIRLEGGRAIACQADVSDTTSVQRMVDTAVTAFGKLDILVNNAAIFASLALKPFEQITSQEWDSVMAVNVRGSFECAKAVAPFMRQQQSGKIINIASGTVFKGTPMFLHYVTSKGAIVAMSRCLARELGGDGICVNTIAPGLTLSEKVAENSDWKGPTAAAIVASRALKREQMPTDLGGTLIYLASSDSDFVTGQVVVVDGGSVTH